MKRAPSFEKHETTSFFCFPAIGFSKIVFNVVSVTRTPVFLRSFPMRIVQKLDTHGMHGPLCRDSTDILRVISFLFSFRVPLAGFLQHSNSTAGGSCHSVKQSGTAQSASKAVMRQERLETRRSYHFPVNAVICKTNFWN